MLLSCGRQLSQWTTIQNMARHFCYVPIKRPSLSNLKKSANKLPEKQLSLSDQIRMRIDTGGPITVAQYMKYVLTNPDAGYYMNRDVFGQRGDFITAPEIGQIFGELLAIWIYIEWHKCGAPKPLQIVELGPGRGTLMKDIIRVLSKFQLSTDLSVHLVEISPFLCQLQSQILCFNGTEMPEESPFYHRGDTISGIPIQWYRSVQSIPSGFSVYLAHEFFDALPVHKFQKTDGVWREILIDVDDLPNETYRFVVSRSETPFLKLFLENIDANEQREHIEYSFECNEIAEYLGQRLEEYGGFGLIMDYGHIGDKTDTFRAFKNHKLHNPLERPGSADLTADVDFKLLQKNLEKKRKLITFGPIQQADFMRQMGGDARLNDLLANNTDPENVDKLKSGYEMLTNTDKMGSRYKFLAMFPQVLQEHLAKFPVAGFS